MPRVASVRRPCCALATFVPRHTLWVPCNVARTQHRLLVPRAVGSTPHVVLRPRHVARTPRCAYATVVLRLHHTGAARAGRPARFWHGACLWPLVGPRLTRAAACAGVGVGVGVGGGAGTAFARGDKWHGACFGAVGTPRAWGRKVARGLQRGRARPVGSAGGGGGAGAGPGPGRRAGLRRPAALRPHARPSVARKAHPRYGGSDPPRRATEGRAFRNIPFVGHAIPFVPHPLRPSARRGILSPWSRRGRPGRPAGGSPVR